MMVDTDILIAGAGPAGLAAACALGTEGHRVILVDPAAPVVDADAPGADLRTTALLQPARDLLDRARVWDGVAPDATALWTMRIVDAATTPPVARDFEARDISDAPFGWNVPNAVLRRALLDRIGALPNVETRFGTSVTALFARDAAARVTLANGTRLTAGLVLACDGRDSPLREMAGIGTRRAGYGQTAITFAVTHTAPHEDVSTEIHASGGPFTLVPLQSDDNGHRSAIVWMDDARAQTRRIALSDAEFLAEAQARSADVMGTLTLASPRAAWPISSVLAERWTARRLALAAEAAHAMPPIGAQGLNTSLKDIAALRDLAATGEPGSPDMLARYERDRHADVALRMAGIDLLNRTSLAGLAPVQALRRMGIAALHDVPPLRRAIMRLGLGA
ncbi:FAD-dependent monooxygenase [uncultured Jannaschia sp.]|uniref:FAD-dependent monooxygenase n=1 Tax=uncultured Jannaschia sp. TaxID=293347 RepID=UPI00260CF491|nr:FAD-dependent monooxygenase [uncultured Jannaschia sp.]